MIQSFRDQGTADVFDGINSKVARKVCPVSLLNVAIRKLEQLDFVAILDDLKVPPGNRLEDLQGSRKGQYSIRVNQQYRVCFKWQAEGSAQVEIVDYQYIDGVEYDSNT